MKLDVTDFTVQREPLNAVTKCEISRRNGPPSGPKIRGGILKKLWFLLALTLAAPASASEDFTAGDLLRTCKDANAYLKTKNKATEATALYCLGYLRGVIEGYSTMLELTPTMDRVYCAPPELTFKDLSKIVATHLTNNASDLKKYSPSSMVLAALKISYPCGEE